MDPILKHHFNSFKTSFEINCEGKTPEETKLKESKAFEKFVNYVLFSLDFPEVFTADVDLLDYVCVGGGNDTGIDGIGIKINDRIVRSIENVKDIADASRKIIVEFVFIQSKMRQGFDIGEFSKFSLGIKSFFSEGYLPENVHIREIREIKDYIYSDPKVISKLENTPRLDIFYVTTGTEASEDANFIGAQKSLSNDLKRGNVYFDNINIKHIGGKQLVKFCRELENKFEVLLDIIDIFPLIVQLKEDIKKAYTFTCKASEFMKILTKEDGQLRRSLFNDNVRDYLGNKGAVNSEIEQTIVENPELFLLCNNGITIVCSNFEQVRDKLVNIENPQIVNGCQTSNSIFNLKDHPNINKVQVLIRIISTDSLGISNKIVRGTNKQNQVLDEAFEATLPFHQEILEPYFLSTDNPVKIYYERRAKQYNEDPLIKKSQIVNLRILTQTFVAMYLNSPHEAHRHEAKLLEEFAGYDDKRRIFSETHDPYLYYVCALTWYMYEKYFRDGLIDEKYKAYKSHLYMIFRYSAGQLPNTFNQSKTVHNHCDKLAQMLTEPQFGIHLKKSLSIFEQAQKLWQERGKSSFGIKDNKEFTDLLIEILRSIGPEITSTVDDEPAWFKGIITNIIWRNGIWFGFIKRGPYSENIYFDSRGFKGDTNRLVPLTPVKYKIGSNYQGEMAVNVEIIGEQYK